MALARVSLVENQIVVRPFGSELLTPLVSQASGYADDAAASAVAADASADASAASAAAAATSADTTYVELEYVQAASWETANKYFVRPIRNIALTGTLAQYRFRLQSPFANVAGSLNWHIVKYGVTPAADGTIVAGQSVTGNSLVTTGNAGIVSILDKEGVAAPAVGDITQYALLDVVRNPSPAGNNPGAALAWRLLEASDTITAPLTDASVSLTLKTPKPLRPVTTYQQTTDLCMIGVRMDESYYVDRTYANQSDHLKIGYMNLKGQMTLSTDLYGINSLWGMVRNQKVEASNFIYKQLDSGTTVETGLVASAFECVFIVGDFADAGDTASWGSNYSLSGRYHGDLVQPITTTRKGYRKDSSVGTVTAATKGANLTVTMAGTQAAIGERVRFTSIYGMPELNDTWFTVTGKAGTPTVLTFAGVNSTSWGTFGGVVTGATNTNPLVVTLPNHGKTAGQSITLSGIPGMTELNSTFTIASVSGSNLTINVDATNWGVFPPTGQYAEREVTGLEGSPANTEWNGIRIVQEASAVMVTPGADVAGLYTDTTTFECTEDSQIDYDWQIDFNEAVGITPATRSGSYVLMFPTSGLNRACSYVNGVQQAVQNIDLRDGTTSQFGFAEKIVAWNADFPDIQFVCENKAGPGFTHSDTGNPVAFAYNVIGIHNDYGTKFYWPIYSVSAPITMAGKVLTGGGRYRVIRGTPIV